MSQSDPLVRLISCCVERSESRVKIADRGRSVQFNNDEGRALHCIQVDGCAVLDGPRADYILVDEQVGDLIIELKGKDVEHALDQLEATLNFWRSIPMNRNRPIAMLVEATRCPAVLKDQKSLAAMKRRFGSLPVKLSSSWKEPRPHSWYFTKHK